MKKDSKSAGGTRPPCSGIFWAIAAILCSLCFGAVAEEIKVGDCLVGTVTEVHQDGSKRVRWSTPDLPACRDSALEAYESGAVADLASTTIGLTIADHLVEGNPLGVPGVIAAKAVLYLAIKNTEPSPERDRFAYRVGAFQWGLAASNLCMIPIPAQALCAVAGVVMYHHKMKGHQ